MHRIHSTCAAAFAAALLISACAQKPPPNVALSADARAGLAGRTLVGAPATPPAMQRIRPTGGAAGGGGGLIGALVAVAVVSALNAAEAAGTDVRNMPAPSVDAGDIAEARLISALAAATGATGATALEADALTTGTSAAGEADPDAPFDPDAPTAAPPAAGDAGTDAIADAATTAANSGGAEPVQVDGVLIAHAMRSTGVLTGETFFYEAGFGGKVTDPATGAELGKAICQRRRDLRYRRDFAFAAATFAGADTAAIRARIEADEAEARADQDAEKGAEAARGQAVEIATREQEQAYIDHIATEFAESCGASLAAVLLGAPG